MDSQLIEKMVRKVVNKNYKNAFAPQKLIKLILDSIPRDMSRFYEISEYIDYAYNFEDLIDTYIDIEVASEWMLKDHSRIQSIYKWKV